MQTYQQYMLNHPQQMSHNLTYDSGAVSFLIPGSLGGQQMQLVDGNFSEGPILGPILDNKVQVTKIPDTKGLLTTFGGTPTESPKKAGNQFKIWMGQNKFNITTLWKTYFPLMLTGTAYR